MCDHSNAQTIVEELLQYLEKADYSIRETLVGGGWREGKGWRGGEKQSMFLPVWSWLEDMMFL